MLFVTMPFIQRTRSSPLTTIFARLPRSNTAAPERSAANSRATSPKLAGVSAPPNSPIRTPAPEEANTGWSGVTAMSKNNHRTFDYSCRLEDSLGFAASRRQVYHRQSASVQGPVHLRRNHANVPLLCSCSRALLD